MLEPGEICRHLGTGLEIDCFSNFELAPERSKRHQGGRRGDREGRLSLPSELLCEDTEPPDKMRPILKLFGSAFPEGDYQGSRIFWEQDHAAHRRVF